MKNSLVILFLFLSGLLFSQEFESRFFTIDENSLPQVFSIEKSFFIQKHTLSVFPKNLGITSENHWQPVSMIDALNKQEAYLNRKNTVRNTITAESLGFRRAVERESTIRIEVRDPHYVRRSGVRNSVYRDASMPFFYNPFYYRNAPRTGF